MPTISIFDVVTRTAPVRTPSWLTRFPANLLFKPFAVTSGQARDHIGRRDPDECIDCGMCEPECPVEAIKPDTEPGAEKWLKLNAEYAKTWPNITVKRAPPVDSKEWEGKPDKLQFFSPNPGAGD